MSYQLGCHATYGGQKCLSVSTGVQPDGAYEFLVHGLAGPGVERHLHGWAWVSTEGLMIAGGARLKDDRDDHVGPGIKLSGAGQEIGRVVVTPTPGGVVTIFRQRDGDDWLETMPSSHTGVVRRTEIPLPSVAPDRATEYSITMFDARTTEPSDTSTQVVAKFSAPVPFGIVFRAV